MAVTILRLHRTDRPSQHLLVQVSHTGNKSLDLKLIGTEHEHLYHAELKESSVKSLQAPSFSGDLNEWKGTLKYALLRDRPDGQIPEYLQGLETVAAISGKSLTITIRKNIGGITQRLGDIQLQQDDEKEEVAAFEWVDAAVATADDLRTQLETLQTSVDEQRQQVQSLSKQLDELVKAKKDHEDELLSKFTALLNAKKLKIRDQQRLLAGARMDPAAADEVSNARSGDGSSRKSGRSRGGKRKAVGDEPEDEDMNGEEEGDGEDEQRQNETPPRSDDEATEDEDGLDDPVPGAISSNTRSNMDIDEPVELPPKRDLPFAMKESKPAPQLEDDDDETDDEL
jgi:hypothetical protein